MSSNRLKIKITIAGRPYPLTVSQTQAEVIKLAADKIQEGVRKLELQYDVKDKQDILAMYILQELSKKEQVNQHQTIETETVVHKLNEMHELLDIFIKE